MNLGGAEILVIIVIAVMVLGPDKLPGALRVFGKTMGEIKKYQDLARGEINKAMESAQVQDTLQDPDDTQIDEVENEDSKKESKPSKPIKRKNVEDEVIAPILDEEDS